MILLIAWKARRLVIRALLIAGALAAVGHYREATIGKVSGASLSVGCHEHHGLPDPRCTPGAIRVGVSLTRICAYDYSRSVRPPEGYTEPLKLRQMRAYGLPGSPREYEEDHLIPLSIGGAPRDPANLWPEPRSGSNNAEQKDQLETWLARMACARRIPLARLQQETARDWIALYRAAGGEPVLRHYPPGG